METAIAGLIGAIIGGVLSYFGNISGVKENYRLLKKEKEYTSAKHLAFLLKQSIVMFEEYLLISEGKALYSDEGRSVYKKRAIYNDQWFEYLPFIDSLQDEDVALLRDWFLFMEEVEKQEGKVRKSSFTSESTGDTTKRDVGAYMLTGEKYQGGKTYVFSEESLGRVKEIIVISEKL